jgi:hypothetical protein
MNARSVPAIGVTGLIFATTCDQFGIVFTETKSDETNVTGKTQINLATWAVSESFIVVAISADNHEKGIPDIIINASDAIA